MTDAERAAAEARVISMIGERLTASQELSVKLADPIASAGVDSLTIVIMHLICARAVAVDLCKMTPHGFMLLAEALGTMGDMGAQLKGN